MKDPGLRWWGEITLRLTAALIAGAAFIAVADSLADTTAQRTALSVGQESGTRPNTGG